MSEDSALVEAVLESSADPVLVFAAGRVVRANSSAAALYGRAPEGAEASELFAEARATWLLESDEPIEATLHLRGSERALSVRLRGAAATGRVLVARPQPDDTEHPFYRALFHVNPAVKLLLEPETGRIFDANPAAAELYGWSLEELRGMRIQQINTMGSDEVTALMMRARRLDRTAFRFEHRTKEGAVRHVEVLTGPVEINGRGLLLSIVFDVTDRERFEAQLSRARRLETVGRLAGGVAHDFNNLLTVLMTSCAVIDKLLPEDSPARTHLGDVEHTAQRAAELTGQLLAFSRRQSLRSERIDLVQLLGKMTGLLERTLGAEYEVRAELDPCPPILADPGQLEQVFLNLALNARDAMAEGGRITLRTGERTLSEPTPALAPGRYAFFGVTDTGEGMTDVTRAHLFEPFYSTKAEGGSGLGLSTVYGIVRQSGGDVEVESEIGVGSTLTVMLPVYAGARPPGRRHEPTPPAGLFAGLRRVLLVEDRDDVREAMAFGLTASGFTVVEAESADEALKRTDLESFDACVSDVRMPGTSGVGLANELRRRFPKLGVLLVSGDLREHAGERIPDGVRLLAKPFSGLDLARALLKTINVAEDA